MNGVRRYVLLCDDVALIASADVDAGGARSIDACFRCTPRLVLPFQSPTNTSSSSSSAATSTQRGNNNDNSTGFTIVLSTNAQTNLAAPTATSALDLATPLGALADDADRMRRVMCKHAERERTERRHWQNSSSPCSNLFRMIYRYPGRRTGVGLAAAAHAPHVRVRRAVVRTFPIERRVDTSSSFDSVFLLVSFT